MNSGMSKYLKKKGTLSDMFLVVALLLKFIIQLRFPRSVAAPSAGKCTLAPLWKSMSAHTFLLLHGLTSTNITRFFHSFSPNSNALLCCMLDHIAGCKVKYAKMGCYSDDGNSPRPLPEELFTDQNPTSAMFTGHHVDYENWDQYLPSLVCRCAEMTFQKGYKVFGLQLFGMTCHSIFLSK